jgi:6-phosphogluconolactonase
MKLILFMTFVLSQCAGAGADVAREAEGASMTTWMYVGTHAGKKSEGIYVMRLNAETGKVGPATLAVKAPAASFVVIHPNGKFLYAVNEVRDPQGKKAGAVCAYAIDRKTGLLTELNHQPCGGMGPCFVGLDHEGKCALVANYGSGSVAVIRIGDDGKLLEPVPAGRVQHQGKSVNPKRQEGPHAHSFFMDPTNTFALAPDLGMDRVMIYKLDASSGTLEAHGSGATAAGAGPRHLAFGKDGKFCYVIDEMGNTVTVFNWEAQKGELHEAQTIGTLPEDFKGESYCSEVLVHPSGKFLYGANRGHDSITVFHIDPSTGRLTLQEQTPCGGHWPRNFGIDPSGKWLVVANEKSDSVVVFEVDPQTGGLRQTDQKIQIGAPMCVRFLAEH